MNLILLERLRGEKYFRASLPTLQGLWIPRDPRDSPLPIIKIACQQMGV